MMQNNNKTLNTNFRKPERVFVWTNSRSLGTIFFKCLSFVPYTQIFYEPYSTAVQLGPERVIDSKNKYYKDAISRYESMKFDFSNLPSIDETRFDSYTSTMESVKKHIEAPVADGVQTIFCKELACMILNNLDQIPKGCRHAFLIRNPYRVLPSWKEMMRSMLRYSKDRMEQVDFRDMPRHHVPAQYGYVEMLELFNYLKEQSNDAPIIIDADDLQNNTTSILKQFLEHFGMPYQDSVV
ncbi:uncharacterized protein [Amphiura filiformis]|uniref:uncharacterized protein n=1 Tax=Amphiura filiformis TaxID=82378 RepID=UPI003B2177A6